MKEIHSNQDATQDKQAVLLPSHERESSPAVAADYWRAQLSGELPVLNFPGARPAAAAHHAATVRQVLPAPLLQKLRSYADDNDRDLFTILAAGLHLLLYKYTHQPDLLTATDGASLATADAHAANTIVLRSLVEGDMPASHFLAQQEALTQAAAQHGHHLFPALQEDLRGTGVTLAPEAFIALREDDGPAPDAPYGLRFLFRIAEELELSIDYNAAVYGARTIQRLPAQLSVLLNALLDDDSLSPDALPYLTAQDRKELQAINNLHFNYPKDKSIADLFRAQARAVPDAIAVVSEGRSLSYRALDELSDRVAHYLIASGVKKESFVLLCFNNHMERSLAGLLGIMKAGCAYVPVDSDLPRERIAFLVRDTASPVVVTNSIDATVFIREPVGAICLDNESEDWYAAPPCALPAAAQDSVAYVIYTSGTTGDPKGAMITHRNLVDYFTGINETIGLAENRTSAALSTLATDLGNTVVFGALVFGNAVHLFPKDALRNIERLHQYFHVNAIDCIKVVPTYWNALEHGGSYLLARRMIIFGGEQLSQITVMRTRKSNPGVRIVNHYGPTETTIGKLLYETSPSDGEHLIPIGRPFSNTRVYIVDRQLAPCAPGVWGELLIGGDGVFRGYLNNPGLTAEKLVDDPERGRLYRTGDLVRLNDEGAIEFGSRADDQVKIQGYRIELGGIEAFIRQYPHVRHCFVHVVDNEDAGKMLVAYIEAGKEYDEEDFRAFLRNSLPAYMIPAALVLVPELPMKSNGKVDKKKLFRTAALKAAPAYEAPQNEVQRVLVSILEDIFNGRRISITDNFYELGGDSIKSIQVASRLRQRGYKLLLKDIIRNPVIKDLSACVKVNGAVAVKDDQLSGEVPLSPIQKLFFEQKQGDYNHYNQSVALHAPALQEEYLRRAFDELVRFHDTLRLRYRNEDGAWKQFYATPETPYVFECVNNEGEEAVTEKMAAMGRSFDLENGPLVRVCLFKGKDEDLLYIVIHHLLIDGVSFRILIEDLSNLYRKLAGRTAFELKHKTASLKEWHNRLIDYSNKAGLLSELPYWQQVDRSASDRIRPGAAVRNTIADREKLGVTLDEADTTDLLTKCYRRYTTETVEILVSALWLSLQDMYGVNSLTINLEGHGREDIGYDTDVSRTLGWFTTIFPVHLGLPAAGRTARLLQVKECLDRLPVKGIGYGVLKFLAGAELPTQPEITLNYLGDFSLANAAQEDVFRAVTFNYQDASPLTACSDIMNVTCIREHGRLSIYFNYNKLLFTREEIAALGQSYRTQLLALIAEVAVD